MRRWPLILTALLISGYSLYSQSQPTPQNKPKLVVAIIVDQFRYDYLHRFRGEYKYGLKRLLEEGAVFDNAHYIHAGTETAPGHSTFLTGALPSTSGIIGNEWYDRALKAQVTSVVDPASKQVGGAPGATGASPVKLLATTLGDQIRAQKQESRIIGVSFKDRAAILPAGRSADGAYWWDIDSNHWVSSQFYMKTLPDWVQDINRSRPYMRSFGAQWMPLDPKPGVKPFCTMVAGSENPRYCNTLMATPWGNEMIEEFAERAIAEEHLGHHEGTDLLTVSFSSNDAVGHAVGPDAPEIRDISLRTDRLLGNLINTLDKQVGLANVALVLTADHGVAPMEPIVGGPPATGEAAQGGRLSAAILGKVVQDALSARFGEGDWVENNTGSALVIRRALAEKLGARWDDVVDTAAESARKLPHLARVYTAHDFDTPPSYDDEIASAMRASYFAGRSPDLMILADPYFTFSAAEASHGTPYDYDNHVPVIFFGSGIRAARYDRKVAPNDIAPTLSDIIGVPAPPQSAGHALREILQSAQ